MLKSASIIYWTNEIDPLAQKVLDEYAGNLVIFQALNEGLEELRRNHYDLVLIASNYEERQLMSFLEELKRKHKNLPVVVHGEDYELRDQLLLEGATDVVLDEMLDAKFIHHIVISAIRSADLDRKRKDSVVQLKKLENRLSTIVGNTPVILFMLDQKGVFKLGLGKLWERFKVNKQFVLGQRLTEVYDEYPAFVDAFKESMKGEVQSVSININNIIFEIVLTPVLDNKQEVKEVIGLAHDVTERARSEMSLLKAKKLAENAAKIKQEFIANMSHEIRTPMNAIVGFINLLEETNLTELQRDYVHSVKISGENLLNLINSILDFSKIESGKMNHEHETFDLNHVINSIDKVLMLKVQEKQLNLEMKIETGVPTELKGDANRLYQILTNLLANAVKFTEKGKVSMVVSCLAVEDEVANLQFDVIDTGIGIPDYMLKKVFDSFTQVNPESNRKYGGTGLGLSIVKKIVEQLNGSISVKSELRKGSRFSVRIPFKKAVDFKVRKAAIDESAKQLSLPDELRILLGEDNVMNQKLVLMILKKFNVHVDLAETGVEVIKALKSNEYDVVLMDIQMPEMDGIEATKIIRKEFEGEKRNIPILAMTAHAFQEELDKCLLVGMNGCIIKPIDTEDFVNKINKSLEEELDQVDLNLSYLKNLFGDDQEMIQEIILTYEQEMPEILDDLQKGIDSNDSDKVYKMAHKAKASFKMLGMERSFTALVNIETDGKKGDTSRAQLLKDFVEEQYTLAVQQLKASDA